MKLDQALFNNNLTAKTKAEGANGASLGGNSLVDGPQQSTAANQEFMQMLAQTKDCATEAESVATHQQLLTNTHSLEGELAKAVSPKEIPTQNLKLKESQVELGEALQGNQQAQVTQQAVQKNAPLTTSEQVMMGRSPAGESDLLKTILTDNQNAPVSAKETLPVETTRISKPQLNLPQGKNEDLLNNEVIKPQLMKPEVATTNIAPEVPQVDPRFAMKQEQTVLNPNLQAKQNINAYQQMAAPKSNLIQLRPQVANTKTELAPINQANSTSEVMPTSPKMMSGNNVLSVVNKGDLNQQMMDFDQQKFNQMTDFESIQNVVDGQGMIKEAASQMTTKTTSSENVLDLGSMDFQDSEAIIKKISDYLVQNKVASQQQVDVRVTHDQLGEMEILVNKNLDGKLNLQVVTNSQEAHVFFKAHQQELVDTLEQQGLKLADFKLETSSSKDNSSFADQGRQQQSAQRHGQHQGRQDSERRHHLWQHAYNQGRAA